MSLSNNPKLSSRSPCLEDLYHGTPSPLSMESSDKKETTPCASATAAGSLAVVVTTPLDVDPDPTPTNDLSLSIDEKKRTQ